MKKVFTCLIIIFAILAFMITCSKTNTKVEVSKISESERDKEEDIKQFSPIEEYQYGRMALANFLSKSYNRLLNPKLYDSPQKKLLPLEEYIINIGQTLVMASKRPDTYKGYRFFILNNPGINAFALPGGFVFVTTGLLSIAENEDEIAAVVAHEITHVQERHPTRTLGKYMKNNPLTKLVGDLGKTIGKLAGVNPHKVNKISQAMERSMNKVVEVAINGYSQEYEFDADEGAVFTMKRAGYNPNALIRILSKLKVGGGVHGDPKDRAKNVKKVIKENNIKFYGNEEIRRERFVKNTAILKKIEKESKVAKNN